MIARAARAHQSADRRQQSGFTGAVGAHDRHDLALAHFERYILEDRHVAITGIEAVDAQHGAHARFLPT
jgi:hypothetical protein